MQQRPTATISTPRSPEADKSVDGLPENQPWSESGGLHLRLSGAACILATCRFALKCSHQFDLDVGAQDHGGLR